MSAQRLRDAATKLRERVEAKRAEDGDFPLRWMTGVDGPTASTEFAFIWTPALALALADWLDKYAAILPEERKVNRPAYSDLSHALTLADTILGPTS